ncbi:heme transporter FLVCR2-like [Phlebotomus argentipes]|uniref:heme transporter FLVCR2-like n=1 Tax=Phlebotomus argentipes TaxID=94469 RepID=UPI002892EC7D|nr:heme transporter FLVCR2-like [Phlebotomus argentipes]
MSTERLLSGFMAFPLSPFSCSLCRWKAETRSFSTSHRFSWEFLLASQILHELAAELTYPEPEGPVAGIMNISTHIFGVLFTIIISRIHDTLGDLAGNLAFTVLLVIGASITAMIKAELKRHSAYKEVASAAEELAQLEKQIVVKTDDF